MNRCLNNVFAYCTSKPNATVEETLVHYLDLGGKTATQKVLITQCKENHRTCSFKVQQDHLRTAGRTLPPSKRRRVKSLSK